MSYHKCKLEIKPLIMQFFKGKIILDNLKTLYKHFFLMIFQNIDVNIYGKFQKL